MIGAALLRALAMVESDDGVTSRNVYQIERIYIEDVNRIEDADYRWEDVYSRERSEEMVRAYLAYYGARYERITGRTPTEEVYARIHNGGPDGWRKRATVRYWRKVRRYL